MEKLRSLFQRARARDYYDIYQLLEQESFDDAKIVAAVHEKARAHEVEIALAQGVPEDDVEAVRAYWDRGLNRLVTEQLSFDAVIERIDTYLKQLESVTE